MSAALRRARMSRRVVLGALLLAPAFGCSTSDQSAELALLQDELWANEAILEAAKDTLVQQQTAARYQLRWMEEIEAAGSASLWEAMRTLGRRPSAFVHRSAFDDVVMRGLLHE